MEGHGDAPFSSSMEQRTGTVQQGYDIEGGRDFGTHHIAAGEASVDVDLINPRYLEDV